MVETVSDTLLQSLGGRVQRSSGRASPMTAYYRHSAATDDTMDVAVRLTVIVLVHLVPEIAASRGLVGSTEGLDAMHLLVSTVAMGGHRMHR